VQYTQKGDSVKTLTIIRGLPGSGKSTFADLLNHVFAVVHEADDHFTDGEGKYNFDPSELGEAHKHCQAGVRYDMEIGREMIIVANTSSQDWEFKVYQDLALEFGYRVHCVIVENRHGGKSSHGVPPEAIERMRNRFDVKL